MRKSDSLAEHSQVSPRQLYMALRPKKLISFLPFRVHVHIAMTNDSNPNAHVARIFVVRAMRICA